MTAAATSTIDEYLRKRLMPVEGAIPQLDGIEMYGNSIPAETVGGDLFEYINFQQRYNIEARIANACKLSKEFLSPLGNRTIPRNEVDAHVLWLKSKAAYTPTQAKHYREAKSSEQRRIAENLKELNTTAGVLMVDAQGHGIIAAKIASTVHDTFHAFMLTELDQKGQVTTEFFEKVNLRLAQSVTARNALGSTEASPREIATMLYGEVRPHGEFRFVSFGHPPPLVFSVQYKRFMKVDRLRMAQFLALGLEIPEDHPDRNRYVSMKLRKRRIESSDMAQLTLIGKGDILFLHTDGVYDGIDEDDLARIEEILRHHENCSAKEICNSILDYAREKDDRLRQINEADRIDDKTVFIIRRT